MLEQTEIFVGNKLHKEEINTVFKEQEDMGTKGVFEERKLSVNERIYKLHWLLKNTHFNQGLVTRAGNCSGKSGK